MKEGKIHDDISPEDPEHVSCGHSRSKSSSQKYFTSDGEIEDNSGVISNTEASVKRRKRVQRFSDSDSEDENQKTGGSSDNETFKNDSKSQAEARIRATSSDNDTVVLKSQTHKSRIKKVYSDSSFDSDSNESVKHSDIPWETSQGSQIKNKKDKIHQDFDNLLTSERKSSEHEDNDRKEEKGEEQNNRNSDASDDEASKSQAHKFRIKKVSLDSSSDSDLNKGDTFSGDLLETNQGSRIKNKRDKLHQKFKNLLTSRIKCIETDDNDTKKEKGEEREEINSDASDDEATSIDKLKQKIKERTLHLKSTIYDPDTSDEESDNNKIKKSQKRSSKKSAESTKPSTKPARMSAKQAMENMQKIKSESNRMLREKEVSLPYHRPKALSLKDIMSRRRPAVSADGKVLPIKMNEDQLKQYALMLEERQKEMMELCKSDTEEEEDIVEDKNDNHNELSSANDKSYDTLIEKPNNEGSRSYIQESVCNENEICKNNIIENKVHNDNELSSANDKSSNTLIEKPNNEESSSNFEELVCNENERNENNINEDKKDNNKELSSSNDKSYDTVIEKSNNEESRSNIQELVSNKSEINKNSNEQNFTILIINENANQKQNSTIKKSSENTLNEFFENEDDQTSIKPYANKGIECLSDEKIDNDQQNEAIDGNSSAEMELVYNDSVEDDDIIPKTSNLAIKNISSEACTENDSQTISLYLGTENSEPVIKRTEINSAEHLNPSIIEENENSDKKQVSEIVENNEFPDNDDDINMEEIDFLIENAEIISSNSKEGAVYSPMLVKDFQPLKRKPKLMGTPGMVIDLDGTDACAPKKSGVELLKERFTYFAKLKTPEELEKEKEKRIKPGTQHLKLKHKLEEMIAEQRSLEWAKRLEEERQQKMEIEAVIDDADCEDDIDKIEAKLEETENMNDEEKSSENEEDLLEDDCEINDKPRNKNPLIDEEAEESEDDDCAVNGGSDDEGNKGDDEGEEADNDDSEDDTEEESSEEDDEEQENPKKGRILKAFEDSDDDEAAYPKEDQEKKVTVNVPVKTSNNVCNSELEKERPPSKNTEDDEIQLAQRHKSFSEDLFTSQESVQLDKNFKENVSHEVSIGDKSLVSHTFSISKSSNTQWYNTEPTDKQNNEKENLDHVVGMCTGSFSQNLVTSQSETQQENPTQDIGDDILALCTGKFYDNQFVSQLDTSDTQKTEKEGAGTHQNNESPIDRGVEYIVKENKQNDSYDKDDSSVNNNTEKNVSENDNQEQRAEDNKLLNSILDELNDQKFETTKPLKYFVGNESQNKENKPVFANSQTKKRLIIDSDDERNYNDISAENKKKKLKKKKLQDRAIQFSDEEEEIDEYDEDEYESEIEDETERIVEYDSEENEVVVQPDKPKKKKKVSEFFEQEAELTSEDEWVGSGDEDEAGLDRMEREAGDDDAFHQGRLRRELEQIHMRDVLDQDKREVRLIQELLLEDGDLGGGHRQRKFRWRDAGGGDEDTTYAELVDTQEEEFESEEQWRKQRHERETFLRQMKQQEEPDESIDINFSRTSLIKANLSSKTANISTLDATDSSIIDKSAADKKTDKDIPSPKKPFTLFKQNYHGSLLTRGQGALARLAALALPLAAADDDAHTARPSHSARNFVFTALSQEDVPPKVTKRKVDASVETPRLVKKMRTADKQKNTKNSLLDHLNT